MDDRRAGLGAPRSYRIHMYRIPIAGQFGKLLLVRRTETAGGYDFSHRVSLFAECALLAHKVAQSPDGPRGRADGLAKLRLRMTLEAIYQSLTEILRDVFDDDTLIARPDLSADQVGGWDSLAHLRVMLTVEKTFKTRFSAAQISSFRNVGELAELIEAKVST